MSAHTLAIPLPTWTEGRERLRKGEVRVRHRSCSSAHVACRCPRTPRLPCVVDVPPLTTLCLGESHAVLADRWPERRRLGPLAQLPS